MSLSRILIPVAVGLSAALTSQAQPTLTQVPTAALATPAEMTDGEVRKVDKEAGKLTLRHAPLVHLDMPAMTMVFRVADPKMFEQVKPGDKVRFKADKISGQFTVTRIEVATP